MGDVYGRCVWPTVPCVWSNFRMNSLAMATLSSIGKKLTDISDILMKKNKIIMYENIILRSI